MVMSVTVNAAQKIPGRVKMVSAYLDPDCEYPLDSGSCYMGQNDKLFSDGLSKSK